MPSKGGGAPSLIFAVFLWMGFSDAASWRLAMVVAGAVCMLTGIAYYLFTTDLPNGNFKQLRESGELNPDEKKSHSFWLAAKDKLEEQKKKQAPANRRKVILDDEDDADDDDAMDVDKKKEKEAVYGEMDFHFSSKGGEDEDAVVLAVVEALFEDLVADSAMALTSRQDAYSADVGAPQLAAAPMEATAGNTLLHQFETA